MEIFDRDNEATSALDDFLERADMPQDHQDAQDDDDNLNETESDGTD